MGITVSNRIFLSDQSNSWDLPMDLPVPLDGDFTDLTVTKHGASSNKRVGFV
jgi:hypothetical protein